MKLRKDGRKKADFRELSMNEKLREEREFDCETSIGSQKLATFPATVGFFAAAAEREKLVGKARIYAKKIKYVPENAGSA